MRDRSATRNGRPPNVRPVTSEGAHSCAPRRGMPKNDGKISIPEGSPDHILLAKAIYDT